MVREVLTINIGQAGIQLGQNIWKQYNAEHKITQTTLNFLLPCLEIHNCLKQS